MRIAEMLQAIASWLESPNNEAILLSEYHADSMKVVAESCVLAAALLRNAADQVGQMEPPEESKITPQAVEEIAALAAAFDASGDARLKKQASVLDELLLSIASPPNALAERKDLLDSRTEELKKKYEDPSKELAKTNKIADSEKAIEKSNMTKTYKIMEAPLSTRYCPDHPGVQIARVGEHLWQCELDKKSYNYETGFELNNGSKVPGGDVSQQTQGVNIPYHAIFDTREGRLGAKTASDNSDAAMPMVIKRVKVEKSPEPEIPEMLGTEEEFKGEDHEWDFLKELLNSPEWKNSDQDTKKLLLKNLKDSLKTL